MRHGLVWDIAYELMLSIEFSAEEQFLLDIGCVFFSFFLFGGGGEGVYSERIIIHNLSSEITCLLVRKPQLYQVTNPKLSNILTLTN